MVEWQVFRDGTEETEVFDVAPVVDTINPFGDYAVVKIDDSQGQKFEQYRRGTELELKVIPEPGDDPISRFVGYVVERRELDQDGADVLEVEAYTFDQFLRRNTVTNDQTGNTISEALEDIVTTDTPITYESTNVEVGDPQELTRSYRGEPVESALRDLAFKSTNENFGVNDDREFFFRPRETVHIDRGIDNTNWLNYDIPELGKEEINEVEVWYNDGDESVIVDNGKSKLDLQDSLGLSSPGTQRKEINRPRLTDISDAEDAGRQYLKFRNTTLSGEITTFGLFEATPGDTIDVTIPQRGIDTEFQIVSIEYEWGRDETLVEVVEKRGFTDDILVRLGEAVQRQEMEGADRDAPKNRITTTDARAIIDVDVDADGNTPDDTRFVNDGRRAVRDGWKGDGNPDIDTLVVGDDGSGLSRSNDSLRNQTNSASLTENLPSAKVVEYSATITQTGVQELGLETAGGTLMCRVVFDTAVDLDGSVTVTLTVSNDDSVDRGVLTNDGQTAVRDVLADNTPALPNAYAYGDDGTAVTESDTALGNELVTVPLDEITLQSASTNANFEELYSQPSNTPLRIQNNAIELVQSCYYTEAEDANLIGFNDPVLGDEYSGGEAIENPNAGDAMEFTFDLDYTIPESEWGIFVRETRGIDDQPHVYQVEVDGQVVVNSQPASSFGSVDFFTPPVSDISNDFDLTQGNHTIKVEVNQEREAFLVVDLFGVFDARFNYNFEDIDLSTVSRSHLNGPELFPDAVTAEFDAATFRKNITAGRFESVWNDTSNNQYIQINNDRFNNTDNSTFSFSSSTDTFNPELRFSRFPVDTDPQEATPRFGYNGQSISSWELLVDAEEPRTDDISQTLARGVVQPDTITGETLREAGLKSDETLLTRHELAEFSVLEGQRLSSSESTTFTGTE